MGRFRISPILPGVFLSVLVLPAARVDAAATSAMHSPEIQTVRATDAFVQLAGSELPWIVEQPGKKFLTGKQLRQLVSGNTTEWVAIHVHGREHTPVDERPSGRTYFSPDGKTIGTIDGRERRGRWWLEKNRIFVKWDKADDAFSAALTSDGNGGHYRVRKRDGQKRSHWKQWFKGKKL